MTFHDQLPSGNTQIRTRSLVFHPAWPWIIWPWKTIGHLFYATSSLCIISKPSVNSNWSYSPANLTLGQSWRFFVLEIWRMTLKNNRAPLLCHFKLCASFCNHQWIQSRVTVQKVLNCFDLCDLDLWPLILNFCMDITSVNGNYSWKLMIRW